MAETKRFHTLIAGVAAGLVGLLVFLTIHHFTIRPIWFIFPVGILLAAGGGAAVGWAFDTMRLYLPSNTFLAALALAGVLTLTQVPGMLIGQGSGPVVDVQESNILEGMRDEIIRRFVFDLLFMAGVVGALAGWLIGRTPRAALAMGAAGLVFAIGPGHNIPFFVGVDLKLASKMLWLMAAIIASSAITLGCVVSWLESK